MRLRSRGIPALGLAWIATTLVLATPEIASSAPGSASVSASAKPPAVVSALPKPSSDVPLAAASTAMPPSLATSASVPPHHPSMDGPPVPAGPLPEGTPGAEGEMPDGHPALGAQQGQPELPEIPPDVAQPDSRVPRGAIEARIVDEKGVPVGGVTVTLGILRTSVAAGESRSRTTLVTNENGDVTFAGLQYGSGWAYRLYVENTNADGSVSAKYSATPFALPLDQGYRVLLHRFPVAATLDQLMVAVGGVDTGIEIRDDVIEIQQSFQVINAGVISWGLGKGLTLKLPPAAKGLRAPESMNDIAITPVEGTGDHAGESASVQWQGSFQPGDTTITYDFKVPYDGEATVDLDLEMPPRVLAARVRLAARRDMTLAVDGFPAADVDTSGFGVHVLQTTRRGDPKNEIRTLGIHIKGLPTQGPTKWIATGLALSSVMLGFFFAFRAPDGEREDRLAKERRLRARRLALDDLVELEKANRDGAIGPKAYARERAKLIDSLADTLEPATEKATAPGKAASTKKAKRKLKVEGDDRA